MLGRKALLEYLAPVRNDSVTAASGTPKKSLIPKPWLGNFEHKTNHTHGVLYIDTDLPEVYLPIQNFGAGIA
jgi:hypothetical protein